VTSLPVRQAYLDGELCGVGPDGITSFSIIKLASDSGNAAALVFFLFDLLHLDGEDFRPPPLIEHKDWLAALLANAPSPLHYSDHQLWSVRLSSDVKEIKLVFSIPRHPPTPRRPLET
jgi:bifunctional non-homologous end joining protein LigD